MSVPLVLIILVASASVLADRCYAQATGSRPSCCSNDRELAAFAAKQHPGQEWGYLNLQQLGEDFEALSNGWTGTIKVPNSAADGQEIEVPVASLSMNAKTHDYFRAVRGYVHRGQGNDGTDILEVTALRHEAKKNQFTKPWMETAGWVDIHQNVALIH